MQIKSADLVVVVTDATRPLDGEQADVLASLARCPPASSTRPTRRARLGPRPSSAAASAPSAPPTKASTTSARHPLPLPASSPEWTNAGPRWWTPRQKDVLEEALGRVELVARMLNG
jgi:hypothetical protein